MSWSQLIAAVVAAVVPILAKFANDYAQRFVEGRLSLGSAPDLPTPEQHAPPEPTPPQGATGPTGPHEAESDQLN
jgi:hypothetical protein